MRLSPSYQKVKIPFIFALSTVQKKETVVNIILPEILCQKSLVKGQRSLSLDDFTHTVEVTFIIPAQKQLVRYKQGCGSVTLWIRTTD
jgi:hypothetical protein